jgi:rhamnulokinase
VAVTPDEFEELAALAETSNSGAPQIGAKLLHASFQARLEGDDLVGGLATLRIDHQGKQPSVLPLAPCSLAIEKPRWEGTPPRDAILTASAVAGMGRSNPSGSAFVASGTWMLAGVERSRPDTSDWARLRNYTNESGARGGFRFLRNVTGFWLLEQCRAAWDDPPIERLLVDAERAGVDVPIVDVDDESLRAPDDMLGAYTSLADLPRDSDPGLVVQSIVESVAVRTAEVIDQLSSVATFDDVVLFGGGARMELLVRRLEEHTGRDVRVGAAEAAALGNAIVQGIAIGAVGSLDEGRAKIDLHPTPEGTR